MIYDDTICQLGEGPLWHPTRKQFFWFDIIGKTLHTKGQSWTFDMYVSAAGWVDHDTLMIASDNGLYRFDIATGAHRLICALDADDPTTRSNDGRADPQGGFWIGTMAIDGTGQAGAIYRYYRGTLRKIFDKIAITNAICFAPDGKTAYFADTPTRQIMQTALDADGWPQGTPAVFIDLNADALNPDGAVVDANGNLWNAQWGASRVAGYRPDGQFLRAYDFPATQASCPAFGGETLQSMFCTSAAVDLDDENPDQGKTFMIDTNVTGQAEHQVIL